MHTSASWIPEWALLGARQQHAVVRTHQVVAASGLNGNRAPSSTYSGIHDADVCTDRQERQRAPQHQCAMADVVFLDLVRDVNDLCFRCDPEDDAMADGRRGVADAPIGGKADERSVGAHSGMVWADSAEPSLRGIVGGDLNT